ncbi:MAG: DUF3090 family protein [Chloroflexia bacterium]
MSMRRPRYDMGRVDWIGAEAVGVPGQRTFRLAVYSKTMSAHLWLEKEELQALTEAIAQMLHEINTERGLQIPLRDLGTDNPKPAGFPDPPEFDLTIGALGLKYDSSREVIALEAHSREDEEQAPPRFRCLTSREQLEKLQANALEVISAGRPRCPLCGAPLTNPGMPHFCPPTNGHQKLTEEES